MCYTPNSSRLSVTFAVYYTRPSSVLHNSNSIKRASVVHPVVMYRYESCTMKKTEC